MYCRVGGDRIFVSTGGRAIDETLPVLLFLHGSGQSHLSWLLQARFFANRGWLVLAPDFPGHGRSGGEPLTSIEAMADWSAALLDGLASRPVTVIGHSQGALVALELARRHAAKISGLALVAAALRIRVNPALLAMARDNEPAAFEAMVGWGHGRDGLFHDHSMPGNSHVNLGKRIMGGNPQGVLAADLAACDGYTDGEAAAGAIRCPSLVILARDDRMTPLREGKALAEALPDADIEIVDDAGHMLPVERGDAVNSALRQLFAKTAEKHRK